jgi:hypothetical protein
MAEDDITVLFRGAPSMTAGGHNPKLPRRNIAVRFSSNSRHYQERCSTPHAAVAPNLVLETRSGDSENPGAWASLAPTFTRGAGMVYALLMPLPLGRRVAGHNPQPEASSTGSQLATAGHYIILQFQ